MTSESSSTWQQRIEGEWYGNPSVWDADGNHTGWIKVARSSVFVDGVTTYYMDTRFDNDGPLRARLETQEFAFQLNDDDKNRVYLGPDFIGAGHPYGSLVDAHYYSPAWQADLRTMVHILADGETQVYSSLLYDGPTIACVFNGVYKVAFDYDSNTETRQRIDTFCAAERQAGRKPHDLPAKKPGQWSGTLVAYGPDQEVAGEVGITIVHRPTSLLRARQTVTLTGLIETSYSFDRYHDGNHHTYDGPDLYGNARAYGRALYATQHLFGTANKVTGREFLYDEALSMSACWKWYHGDQMQYLLYGALSWQADS
jgi:hypothetical protein